MRGALRATVKYLLWTQLAFSTQIFQKCSTQVYVISNSFYKQANKSQLNKRIVCLHKSLLLIKLTIIV